MDIDAISSVVVGEAINVHRELGPGLLESVYEAVLAVALGRRGLHVARQVPVPIEYDGLRIEGSIPCRSFDRGCIGCRDQVSRTAPENPRQTTSDLSALDETARRAAIELFRPHDERRHSSFGQQPSTGRIGLCDLCAKIKNFRSMIWKTVFLT